ncbi:unnamed protein product [Sympodiomycopsis kandeliae]
MHFLQATLYYLLGGVTFLPLVFLVGLIHFIFFTPKVNDSTDKNILDQKAKYLADANDDLDETFSPARKAAAIELAVRNQQTLQQQQPAGNHDGDDHLAKHIPGSARRVQTTSHHHLPKAHRQGWLVVRRQFDPSAVHVGHTAGTVSAAASATDTGSSTTGASTIIKAPGAHLPAANAPPGTLPSTLNHHNHKHKNETAHNAGPNTNTNASQPQQSTGYMSAMYRGIMDYRANRRQPPPATSQETTAQPRTTPAPPASNAAQQQDTYFCILKTPTLYLYSSSEVDNPATECLAAIDLRGKRVSIYVNGMGDVEGEPEGYQQEGQANGLDLSAETTADEQEDHPQQSLSARIASRWKQARRLAIKDGELFQKRNAIRILSVPGNANKQQHDEDHDDDNDEAPVRQEWFIFLRSAMMLEDWYHALVQASLAPTEKDQLPPDLTGAVFDTEDMQSLVGSLDSLPDPIPLRWLNGMVGRIFFSVYRTAWIEDYVTRKLMKKISRVRTPGFLSDIRVQEVHLGSTPPAFSRPMLKSLTPQGEASMEVSIHYRGNMRLTISTVLTISLGARFKQYNVPLVLAVVLTSLEGDLRLQIKPPPSNRVWYGFTSLPKMDIEVEPVVSERKVQWSMVKRLIEGRIKELMTESMVVPNMDDIPFFDTRPNNTRRGGIWADAAVRNNPEEGDKGKKVGSESLKKKSMDSLKSRFHRDKHEEMETGSTTSRTVDGGGEGSIRNRKGAPSEQGSDTTARNRKSLPGQEVVSSSAPATANVSPAVAALSAVAAKSSQDSTVHPSSSPQQQQKKRKSWFSTNTSTPSSSSSSSLPPLPRQHLPGGKDSRSKGPQSSLAWGSASVQLPPEHSHAVHNNNNKAQAQTQTQTLSQQRSSPALSAQGISTDPISDADVDLATDANESAKSTREDIADLDLSTTAGDATPSGQGAISDLNLDVTPSATSGHQKDKESISSVLTDSSTTTADTDIVQAALENSLVLDEQGSQDQSDVQTPHPVASQAVPELVLQAPTEDDRGQTREDGGLGEASEDTVSLNKSPVSLAASSLNKSPVSLASSQISATDSLPPSLDLNLSASGQDESVRGATPVSDTDSVRYRPSHGFAPPPRRSPVPGAVSGTVAQSSLPQASAEQGSSTDSASYPSAFTPHASSRDSLHRVASRSSSTSASSNSPSMKGLSMLNLNPRTQETLNNTWLKAKSSMADKESRSAAAKEAKDAIRKGWSNWNSKRQPQQPPSSDNNRGHLPGVRSDFEQSQQQHQQSGSLAWLGETVGTDPASLGGGFGFEMSPSGSPEWQQHLAADRRGLSSSSSNASVASSSGTAPSYREFRANRQSQSNTPSRSASPSIKSSTEKHTGHDGDGIHPMDDRAALAGSNQTDGAIATERENSSSVVASGSDPVTREGTVGSSIAEDAGREGTVVSPPLVRISSSDKNDRQQEEKPSHTASSPDPTTTSPQRPEATRRTSSSSSGTPTSTPRDKHRRKSSSSTTTTPSSRIRSQPGQRTMMAVPGIQKRNSNEPTSFEAQSPVIASEQQGPTGSPLGKFKLPLPSFGFGTSGSGGNTAVSGATAIATSEGATPGAGLGIASSGSEQIGNAAAATEGTATTGVKAEAPSAKDDDKD